MPTRAPTLGLDLPGWLLSTHSRRGQSTAIASPLHQIGAAAVGTSVRSNHGEGHAS